MDELIEQIPCGFVSFTDDGRIERVNARLLERLGYQRADLEGKPFESIMNVGSRIFYQTHLFPLLAMHQRADEIFLLLRASDGSDIGFLVNAVRRERNGHKVNDCALMRVEERRKYEDALLRAKKEVEAARETAEEANKAKSKFLAVMSHELRTPLNAIGGYTQLLEMGVHGPVTEDQLKALDRISRSQKHLLRLINDVLNLSRIESGREEYRITDVPLGDVISAVLPMVEPQAAAKGITSRTVIDRPYVVRSDKEKLEQIVLNLLTNATKFTPSGGAITVRTRGDCADKKVCLDIQDTGIGISSEKLKDIFEPFVQVQSEQKKEGSGLGLAISRELARGMDADLTVRSEPGKGSVFTITLPVVQPV